MRTTLRIAGWPVQVTLDGADSCMFASAIALEPALARFDQRLREIPGKKYGIDGMSLPAGTTRHRTLDMAGADADVIERMLAANDGRPLDRLFEVRTVETAGAATQVVLLHERQVPFPVSVPMDPPASRVAPGRHRSLPLR